MTPMVLHRLTAGGLLLVYGWTALGVPLPQFSAVKRSSERFPCESCRCGCATAEQCWRSCCCHTLGQRLAWAKRNGVQPPKYVLAQACRAGIAVACCSTSNTTNRRSCCAADSGQSSSCCQSQSKTPTSGSRDGVVAWRALACKGQTLKWLAAPVTTVSVRIEMCDLLPPVAWMRPSVCDSAPGRSDEPATPPPRCA